MRGPHQAKQAVCVENEVCCFGFPVTDDGVHAPDLEVGGDDLQVVINAAQVRLLQLHADVLCDQINGHHILIPKHT